MAVARTHLGFQRIRLDDDDHEAQTFWDPRVRSSSRVRAEPVRVTPDMVWLFQPELGYGASGVAYRCRVAGHGEWVVKVPLALMTDDEGPLDGSFGACDQAYRAEVANAEWLLEPRGYTESLAHAADWDRARVTALHSEMARMRAHPGYAHIHKLVHAEWAPIPMIFSEACDESLRTTVHMAYPDYATTDRTDWRAVATQMLAALDYTRMRELLHMDIKPENILVRRSAAGRRTYLLADFGLCHPLRTPLRRAMGTRAFFPSFRAEEGTPLAWSAGQLATTLVSLLGRNLQQDDTTAPSAPFAEPLSALIHTPMETEASLERLRASLLFAADAPRQDKVTRQHGDTLGVDAAEVGVLHASASGDGRRRKRKKTTDLE